MSPAEQALREAQQEWEKSLEEWTEAQEHIRVAKARWSAAQQEFFTGIKVLAFQTSCSSGGCSTCPSQGGC